jgi:hypothetical protein
LQILLEPGSIQSNIGDSDNVNMIVKLASRIQFSQTFVGERPRNQKPHIFEYSVRILGLGINLQE